MQFRHWVFLIFFASLTIQAQQPPPPLPTWQDEIAKDFVPYHQLTTADLSDQRQGSPGNVILAEHVPSLLLSLPHKIEPGRRRLCLCHGLDDLFRSQQERDLAAEQ